MSVSTLVALKNRLQPDMYARDEIVRWVMDHLAQGGISHGRVLDIGIGGAEDLARLSNAATGIQLDVFGVEHHPKRAAAARALGIEVFQIDIERQSIPLPDGSIDAVMANHVIEHLKEIFFFFSEVSRVLRPGGIAVIGCPNLGGWHNRLALLFGAEPPCMRLLGSHVRGITIPGFKRFIEFGGFFRVERVRGRAFYMLPRRLGSAVAAVLPGLGAGVHFVIQRTDKSGRFIDVLDMGVSGVDDTPYVRTPVG